MVDGQPDLLNHVVRICQPSPSNLPSPIPSTLKQLHNIGLCFVYALVGFVPSFISTPLSVYLVHTLNAHPVIQNQVSICMSLPWALKIFLGFTSDALPLCGERRRPYIFLGTLLWAGFFLYLSYIGNPSGPMLCFCLCLSTVGMVLCDTISDAMIVERSTKECEEDHGHLQSLVYAVRFGAAVLGAVLGGLVYNEWSFSMTFAEIMCLAGVLPLVLLLPSLGFVKDMPRPRLSSVVVAAAGEGAVASVVEEVGEVEGHPPVSQQLRQIWDTVTLRVVFQPMAFVFVYNLFQVPNVSWNSFLQLTLGFTPVMLGALSFGGRLMTFVGILIYKRYFLGSSWRAVYVFSTVLLALLSVLQLLLIFQINTYLGISNFLFSLGDDVMSAFITGTSGGREEGR
jgi:MFS family permease